ncbi:UTP--glucose-1-phosphate uridylyltransferase [Aquirhabdus parva]|uniref:UTP--glucose-1-phosphate uridylyltransferase n=1 Tax=Aquirhabdus parva TaxID=2283318 RepID=UPI001AE23D46|nr:UTP--glucose-1-phosphate uridylyltransferase [Aquirhabdus parva]
MSVEIVVLPVAGLGSRFLPATKVTPKEMLPIVDVPLVQLAVEEAVRAGVREIVLVTSPLKPTIEAHFREATALESVLVHKGNKLGLDAVRNTLPEGVVIHVVFQLEALGLGHAVLCAKDIVGNRPFAVMLPDDLIDSSGLGCLADMVEIYKERGSYSLAVENVAIEHTNKYGIATLDGNRIIGLVEKPDPSVAPSTLAIVGRYILPPEIFPVLETINAGAGGEIQLTDGISALLNTYIFEIQKLNGTRYDCGSKLGHLQANIVYAFKDKALAEQLYHWLNEEFLLSYSAAPI